MTSGVLLVACLVGCDNVNRSLVFFTNTSVGLEAGVDPTTSSGKVLLGYKRQEGVLNPVYQPPLPTSANGDGTRNYADGTGAEDVYLDRAYSVIAKIAGEGNAQAGQGVAGAEAAAAVAQWFATGEAAIKLAEHPATAGAVTGSAEIARAASGERVGARLLSLDGTALSAEISRIYAALDEWALTGDRKAGELRDAADRMARAQLILAPEFDAFSDSGGVNAYNVVAVDRQGELRRVLGYAEDARVTVDEIASIASNADGHTYVSIASDGTRNTVTLDASHRAALMQNRDKAREGLDYAGSLLAESPEVLELLRYYAESLIEPVGE